MGIFDHVEVWSDVLEERLDEFQAPELDYLFRREPIYRMYSDSREFFSRTLVTENMLSVVEGVVDALEGSGNRIFLLYSFFGGGKTHTLLTIYHALRDPQAFLEAIRESSSTHPGDRIKFVERGRRLVERLRSLGSVKIVVISGKFERLFPDPSHPITVAGVSVRTLWGYLGALLGRYDIIAADDASARAPAIDRLEELLSGERVLILADEVADRLAVLMQSSSQADRDYARQIISFFDNLFQAATRTQTAIVFTLPGEEREGRLVLEDRYRGTIAEQAVSSIVRAARRVGSIVIEPVSSGEFWRILQRRLFRRIDSEYAVDISIELRNVYESEQSVFGSDTSYAEKLRQMYPLHPGFVEALRTIIERNNKLQKTRDAIKIARRILRRLYNQYKSRGKLDEDMIMAWHIDPSNPDTSIILHGFEAYKIVVDVDLVDNMRKLEAELGEKAELARMIALAVFVTTYTFQSPRSLPQFPTKEKIAQLVYDPSLFGSRQWLPSDILDVVEDLKRSLYYLWTDGERYWFWNVANINQIIEQKARQLAEEKGYELLREVIGSDDYLRGLISRRLTRDRRLGGRIKLRLFEYYDSFETPAFEDIKDDDKYKLIVAIRPPLEGFEKLVTHAVKGGRLAPRIYGNTVVVLAPRNPEDFESAVISTFAKVKAAEQAEKELSSIVQGLMDVPPELRSAIRKIQSTLVRDVKENALSRLYEIMLNNLDVIYYPSDGGASRIDASQLGVAAMSLAEKVEYALERIGKAVFEASFDYILSKLEDANIDLSKPKKVSELVSVFRMRPSLPMIPRSVVVKALLEGHKNGNIIVERTSGENRQLYFNRIVEGPCDSGKPKIASELRDDDIIMLADPDKASEETAKTLLDYLRRLEIAETRPDGSIVVRNVLVELHDQVIGLESFLEQVGYEPSIVFAAKYCIVEKVKKPGVRLRLSSERVTIDEEETIIVKATIEPVGDVDPGKIRLEAFTSGNGVEVDLDKTEAKAWDEIEIKIKALHSGDYTISLRALPERGDSDEAVIYVTVRGREEIVECERLEEVPGNIVGLTMEGEWSSLSLALENLAGNYPNVLARASLKAAGISLSIDEPQKLDVVVELMKSIVDALKDLVDVREKEVSVKVEVDFAERMANKAIIKRSVSLPVGGSLRCLAQVRRG